jgi:hypothetical protein
LCHTEEKTDAIEKDKEYVLMQLPTQKEFNTRLLIGESIIVGTRHGNLEFSGILKEFFERNESLVIENFAMTLRKDDDTKEILDSGDIIILKRDAWVNIRCRDFYKKKKRK